MSYQPEERYWTDYLRIALPVVGLLLMLGLFWYWASAVIGNDDENQPAPRPTNAVAVITAEAPTPTATSEINLAIETMTPEAAANGGATTNQAATQPTQPSANQVPGDDDDTPEPLGQGFEVGETVQTNTSGVRLRADKSTGSDVVTTLDEGTLMTVTEAADEQIGDYFWIGVRTANGQDGYVADEFVESAE